ncbi:MAG TPA: aromatic ring-hydroxylating dioxygenase subunit alpha [Novosphingobium sp.]|nr:aromatic ring-hydroxylating dioxygenase subunit alpha [Novosphingobium sp.]
MTETTPASAPQAPLRSDPHPISGALYTELGDGLVRVEDKAKGKSGLFRYDGVWIEGDLTYADPHMLRHVGGPDLPPGRDIFWAFLPPLESDTPTVMATTARNASDKADAPQRPKIIAPYVGDPGKETPEGMRSASQVPLEYLIENDRRPDLVPEVYRKSAPYPGGPVKVPVARYFEQKYHDLEVEHIWKKCWQLVCREDDIPEVGDYHLYEIAELQYLVVRTAPDEIKAHVNACLHRGRQLRECHGKRATEFRCPYHGWQWNIDGSLRLITAEWDFPGVREDVGQLPGAQVATWGGFVFINPDPDAISFEDYAGPEMLAHYAKTKLANRYKQADVVKVLNANWKIAQEAFQEGWHSLATHPQLLLQGGDLGDLRFDVFGNWGRLGHVGVSGSSPHRGIVLSEQAVLESYRMSADFMKGYLRSLIGDEVEEYSDAELNEQTFNNLFPNFSPWGGWGRIVYRFRPYKGDPNKCYMQAMLLAPWPEGKPKPLPKAQRFLAEDEPWTNAPELGGLAKIFEQDCGNIPQVHIGLKTKQPPHIWLSGYQEAILRAWHDNYAARLGLKDGE